MGLRTCKLPPYTHTHKPSTTRTQSMEYKTHKLTVRDVWNMSLKAALQCVFVVYHRGWRCCCISNTNRQQKQASYLYSFSRHVHTWSYFSLPCLFLFLFTIVWYGANKTPTCSLKKEATVLELLQRWKGGPVFFKRFFFKILLLQEWLERVLRT